MKFLSKLVSQYDALSLTKPQWVLEYDSTAANPALNAAGQVTSNIGSQLGPTAVGSFTNVAGKSVVDSLMNAMNVLGNTPTVQKLKPAVVKAKTDVEKAVTDTTSKVLDKLNAVKAELNKTAAPAAATVPSPTAATTP